MTLRLTLSAAILLSVVACANDPPIPQAQCHAVGAEAVLGKNVDEQLIDQAIQRSGALRSRVIRPGANVTQDLDPLRLNIEVDETGRIRRLRCG